VVGIEQQAFACASLAAVAWASWSAPAVLQAAPLTLDVSDIASAVCCPAEGAWSAAEAPKLSGRGPLLAAG
jgi:hypothetical protein